RHARPARRPAPARSDPVSRPAAPAASRVRQPAHGGDARPSNKPPRSPSSETAATTSPRSKRSPQTALLSPGRSDRSPPTPQLDHADLSNRVSPSMLAPSPSQHLESEIRPHGNPPYDSDIPNPALTRITLSGLCLCVLARAAEEWVPAFAGTAAFMTAKGCPAVCGG